VKKWLLETNTLIHAINRQGTVRHRVNRAALEGVVLTSVLVVSELLFGAEMSARRDENRRHILSAIRNIKVVPFDMKAAEQHVQLRAHFEKIGKRRPRMDLMIAAQAAAEGAILVTQDSDLTDVEIPGVLVETWT
jgi:tRNA(fMet)-specific endonuclease VapC